MTVLLLVGACADDGDLRGSGACTQEECEANLCFDSNCIPVAPSEDDDYLTREQEVRLGTGFSDPDTDGDGWLDGLEIVTVDVPHDEDGDGKSDALESTESDADGDCLVDQKDPNDLEVETDLARLAELGCCCYGPCSAWGIEVSEAACEVDEDGTATLICPESLQADSDGDGRADACDLCPYDANDDCSWAPHGLRTDPVSPASSVTPMVHGYAFWAQSVSLHALECGEEVLVAEDISVASNGRFSAPLTVEEMSTTTLIARAHRIGGLVSGDSEPLVYSHVSPRPALEIKDDDTWRMVHVSGDPELRLRVTTEAVGDEWFLFPTSNCVPQGKSWSAPMWESTEDEMVLTSGHINLGSDGKETVFTTRVRYADGSESPCSRAAVYVRQQSTPAIAAWWVYPESGLADHIDKVLRYRVPSATLRLAASDDVTALSVYDGEECAGEPRLTQESGLDTESGYADVVLSFDAPDDAVTAFDLSVQARDAAGELSECMSGLRFDYDPLPPPTPEVTLSISAASEETWLVSGDAGDAVSLTLYAGLGCGPCVATMTHMLEADREPPGAFEFPWGEVPESEGFSARSTDEAGNLSPCLELLTP
ncbi:MAG: hypothetical protein ACPGU1_16065 [Myxococcota bacterium]